jgi:hypothetical protein
MQFFIIPRITTPSSQLQSHASLCPILPSTYRPYLSPPPFHPEQGAAGLPSPSLSRPAPHAALLLLAGHHRTLPPSPSQAASGAPSPHRRGQHRAPPPPPITASIWCLCIFPITASFRRRRPSLSCFVIGDPCSTRWSIQYLIFSFVPKSHLPHEINQSSSR